MPVSNFLVYAGIYDRVEDALSDYEDAKKLHSEHVIADFDAAVVERREDGKVKIRKQHETPTRKGALGGGVFGLATGVVVALFPAAALGEGIILATTGGGAVLGALAGHAAAGMSRKDLKEIGEHLDAGQAGLVLVAATDIGDQVRQAMPKANKVESKQMTADPAQVEEDVKELQTDKDANAKAPTS